MKMVRLPFPDMSYNVFGGTLNLTLLYSLTDGMEDFSKRNNSSILYGPMLFSRWSCMMIRISYSQDGSFIHIPKRAHSQQSSN